MVLFNFIRDDGWHACLFSDLCLFCLILFVLFEIGYTCLWFLFYLYDSHCIYFLLCIIRKRGDVDEMCV